MCSNCNNCFNCWDCDNCDDCENCVKCIGIVGGEWMYKNKKVTPEEMDKLTESKDNRWTS